MAEDSNIEWTQNTFNPWIGCTKVSEGCLRCYAETGDRYRHWTPQGWGQGKPRRRTSDENWKAPLKWNRAAAQSGRRAKVFCASLADVFDQEIDLAWREDLGALIRQCSHLDWQLLTKRPESIATCLPDDWGSGWSNVWLGIRPSRDDGGRFRMFQFLDDGRRYQHLTKEAGQHFDITD